MRGFACSMLSITVSLQAQEAKKIDAKRSEITVHVFKAGWFSFAGHDHVISAPIAKGTLDENGQSIEFTVNTAEMQVVDPGESDKNRAEIRKTMLGQQLLEADKFPTITFRSVSVRQTDAATAVVQGVLTLHGARSSVSLTVKKQGSRYIGSTKLKQSEYGLIPVSVAGGTVRVKDEVIVEFEITTE